MLPKLTHTRLVLYKGSVDPAGGGDVVCVYGVYVRLQKNAQEDSTMTHTVQCHAGL